MKKNTKTENKYLKIGKVRANGFSFEMTPLMVKKIKNAKKSEDIGQMTLDALNKHISTLT
jgi:hypothetical protein